MTAKTNRRVPGLCRHRASGQAVVRLDGKDHYCGPWGSTAAKAAYDRLVAIYLAHNRRMPAEDGAAYTIAQLLLDFFAFAEQHYRKPDGRPTSEVSCLKVATRPLRRLFDATPACEFGPLKLSAVRQAMIEHGLTRRSINLHVGRIKRMFRWAASTERIPASVYQGLQTLPGLQRGRSAAVDTDPIGPVPPADVLSVLPHLTPPIAAMTTVMLVTGARVGEVTTMRTGDIDRSGPVWLYRPGSHKTEHRGRARVIALGPKAQDAIRPFLKADPGAFLFVPREGLAAHAEAQHEQRQSPMTPSQAGRAARARLRPRRRLADHYTATTVRVAIRRACIKAKVTHFHPHQLRHTAATLLQREFGIEAARVVLGHASPAVTALYAEADQAKAVEVMAKVG